MQLKEISNRSVHHAWAHNFSLPVTTYYQANWEPDFSYLFEVSIGQASSDGHKWVCDPHRFALNYKQTTKTVEDSADDKHTNDSLVYSVGSNGKFSFERDLFDMAPHCEIHIFDPKNFTQQMVENGVGGSFHVWGMKSSNEIEVATSSTNKVGEDFKSLSETMEILGHSGRRIDVFKIDCEGCEWTMYKDFFKHDLRQIQIEVHGVKNETPKFFEDMHAEGYVIFHKKPNIQWAGGTCVEFSFLKSAKEFFQ